MSLRDELMLMVEACPHDWSEEHVDLVCQLQEKSLSRVKERIRMLPELSEDSYSQIDINDFKEDVLWVLEEELG